MEHMETVTDLTKGIYRRMYSGFIKGQRINKLSIQAEAWFWRVLASADDFGNMDADPCICHAATVGRRKGISIKDVEKILIELGESGLIQMYAGESGDKYLHIVGFEELQPAGKNGKRVQRFPRFDGSGESRIIQNNPDFLNSSSASHSHSHSHSDNHTEDDPDPHSGDDTDQPRALRADKRGTRLPDDFCLNSEKREWAAKNTPHVDLNLALAEFVDYWHGVPGQRGRKLDWDATWRNRLRDLEGRKNGSRRGSKVEGSMDAVKSVLAEYENEH